MSWWSGIGASFWRSLSAALLCATACAGESRVMSDDGGTGATSGSGGGSNASTGGTSTGGRGGVSTGGASMGGASVGGASVGGASAGEASLGGIGAAGSGAGRASVGGRGGASPMGGRSGAGGTRAGTMGDGGSPEGGETSDGGDTGGPGCRTLGEVFVTDRASLEALHDVCEITWVLHVRGDVDDLLPLSNLVRSSSIDIYDTNLVSLNGLERITTVGTLSIQANPLLSGLSGLQNLTRADDVYISHNARLPHVDGLAGLREVTEILVLRNPELRSLTGLANVTLHGDESKVSIMDNDSLMNLDGLASVRPDALFITDNDLLRDITGIGIAATVNSLGIWNNASLLHLAGLEELEQASSFYVYDNPALENVDALQNLSAVYGEFMLRNNDALANVDGFQNLVIGGNLRIEGNDALEHLDGFSGLSEIGRTYPDGGLLIDANLVLRRLRGMASLEWIAAGLRVTNNPALPTCEAEWLRDSVENLGGFLIDGNDSGATCPP